MGSSLKDGLVKAGVVKESETPQAKQKSDAEARQRREMAEIEARMDEPAAPLFEAPPKGRIVDSRVPPKKR